MNTLDNTKETSSSRTQPLSPKQGRSPLNRSMNSKTNKKKVTVKKKGPCDKIAKAKKHSSSKAKTTKLKQKHAAKKNEKKQFDPKIIESKIKERINSIPALEKNTIRLEWPSKSISARDEEFVACKVVADGHYGPLDAKQMADIEDRIKSTEMSLSQALSLRSTLLQQKAMRRCGSLRRQAKKVYSQYRAGHTVLDLAKKTDQPPMNVLRVILKEMKWSKEQIKKALRDPKQFKNRERNEFVAAESMDLVSMVNQSEIHEHSDQFEDLLSDWLTQKGIRFVRQKELEREQKKEFGTQILTPDFLILDEVLIDGTPCHWIDCKAFYGANLQFSIKNTKKQMARYINHWGSGAIVYLQGFSTAIKIHGDCALLNAYGALDVDLLSTLEAKICQAKNTVSSTTFNDGK